MIKGAIFDVDGTLLDSMGVWRDITQIIFDKYGIPLDDELNDNFQGMTLEESTSYMVQRLGFPVSEKQLTIELLEAVKNAYLYKLELKPGAYEYVKKLYGSGVVLGVATSGYEELCTGAFKRLGIYDMFSAFAFSSEVGVNKSNPDVYLLAAERMGVEPSECEVYEDIELGIYGAKKGGMKTVAVFDETTPDFECVKNAADRYIMSFEEIL